MTKSPWERFAETAQIQGSVTKEAKERAENIALAIAAVLVKERDYETAVAGLVRALGGMIALATDAKALEENLARVTAGLELVARNDFPHCQEIRRRQKERK